MTKMELGPTGHTVRVNLERLRADRHLTYVGLAARLTAIGRPIAALGLRRIEKGERRVDVDDLAALAAALNVAPARLLAAASDCASCLDSPPPGFICAACHATGETEV